MFKKIILASLIAISIISNSKLVLADVNFKILIVYDDFISEEEKSLFSHLGYGNEYIKANEINENKIQNSKYIVYITKNDITEEMINSIDIIDKNIYILGLSKGSIKLNAESMIYKNTTYRNSEIKHINKLEIGDSVNIATISNSIEEIPYIMKKQNLYIQPNFNIDNIVEKLITKDFMYDFFELNVANNREYIFFENESSLYYTDLIDKLLYNGALNSLEAKVIPINLDNTTEIKQYSILRNGVLFINLDKDVDENKLEVLQNYIESMGFHKGNLTKEVDNISIEKDNNIYIIKDKVKGVEKTTFGKVSTYFAIIILVLLIIFIWILRNNNKEHRKKLFKE